MKIYRIPIGNKFRPDHQNYIWPPQNQKPGWDFGVEQDFDLWLEKHPELTTIDPSEADWMYVPIYWNRYYINTTDAQGHWGAGIEALSEEVDLCLSNNAPTFTIAEADVKWLKPSINWKDMVIFCASRRDENGGIDIPLLSAPHEFTRIYPNKKFLASFVGSLGTDEVRNEMQKELSERKDCWVEHANNGTEYFIDLMISSYIALCPRGQGAQSFRFYEAMQLETVPLYISDLDCRPFKKWIDWNKCSFWVENANNLSSYLRGLEISYGDDLRIKGQNAKYAYDKFLSYGNWCPYVIKELELL